MELPAMLLQRERPRTPDARALRLPARDSADRPLPAPAGALLLASWAVTYVALVPADAGPHRTNAIVRVTR